MRYAPDLASAIGNTPLIKLRRASEETGCTILGKAEFMNPGQSVKDRAALSIIKEAVATARCAQGEPLSKVRRAIPVSVLHWSVHQWVSKQSS